MFRIEVGDNAVGAALVVALVQEGIVCRGDHKGRPYRQLISINTYRALYARSRQHISRIVKAWSRPHIRNVVLLEA